MPIIAGLFGGISGSFVRGFTCCLNEKDGFSNPFTWLYFVLMWSASFVQLRNLNRSMALYDQIEIVPIYQASLILLNMLSGVVIMQESSKYQSSELIFLLVCLIVCISGVFTIAKRPNLACIKQNRLTNLDKIDYAIAKEPAASPTKTRASEIAESPGIQMTPRSEKYEMKEEV